MAKRITEEDLFGDTDDGSSIGSLAVDERDPIEANEMVISDDDLLDEDLLGDEDLASLLDAVEEEEKANKDSVKVVLDRIFVGFFFFFNSIQQRC